VRIISGKYKRRRIPVPSSFNARPTTDFSRVGLFNVLANTWDFEGLAVLDLFSGTGSIGFEFASRGAARVDMVEKDPASARFLQKTAGMLAASNVRVIASDAMAFIVRCPSRYDIVFADPPYRMDAIPGIPARVLETGILEDEGWFILEHGRNFSFASHPGFRGMRKYGNVHFSFFS
jgi:16S rRNA (guanine966-N2)-methyltransferase